MRNGVRQRLIITAAAALLLSVSGGSARNWYVSPSGSGAKDGSSPANAFSAVSDGVSSAGPGDSIILAGGTHQVSARVNITASGTAGAPIHLAAENPSTRRAVLDFTSQGFGSSNQGISLKGNYWHIVGLDIMNAGDNGMIVDGGYYDTIEWCSFHENSDAGLQLRHGASHDLVLNCDSWWNYDAPTNGGNADGFAPKLDVGDSVIFRGCRSWGNSDDGWDGYLKTAGTAYPDNMLTIIENCWAFDNGYYHGDPNSPNNSGSMNGNGFKMGGSSTPYVRHPHILRNCLSFFNKAKQFDQNHNMGSMTLFNCTAYSGVNGRNYAITEALTDGILAVKNCISTGGGSVSLLAGDVEATNSWSAGLSVSNADFRSVDTAGVRGPRKTDGSLPDVAFMHLSASSALIDAGTDVGLPFSGAKPDLGAFEFQNSSGAIHKTTSSFFPVKFSQCMRLADSYRIDISYNLPCDACIAIGSYGADGRRIEILQNGKESRGVHHHAIRLPARSLSVGFIKITENGCRAQSKAMVFQ